MPPYNRLCQRIPISCLTLHTPSESREQFSRTLLWPGKKPAQTWLREKNVHALTSCLQKHFIFAVHKKPPIYHNNVATVSLSLALMSKNQYRSLEDGNLTCCQTTRENDGLAFRLWRPAELLPFFFTPREFRAEVNFLSGNGIRSRVGTQSLEELVHTCRDRDDDNGKFVCKRIITTILKSTRHGFPKFYYVL